MLCQFSFKNFNSYRDETTFDFQAAALPEFNDNLIKREKCNDILPVGVIYGPNGGGKTNLLEALSCLISTVVKPIYDLEKNRIPLIFQKRLLAHHLLLMRRLQQSLQSSGFSFGQKDMNICTILRFLIMRWYPNP